MARRESDNPVGSRDDRMDDETRGTDEIRGIAEEGDEEFEDTDDLEEEEDEGTF